MTDPAAEELRPIVEAAKDIVTLADAYTAAYRSNSGTTEALVEFRAAQARFDVLNPGGVDVDTIAHFAPLLAAYEELERRLALAEAERDRFKDALKACGTEAHDAISGAGADEDETYCFGNLIHVQRIVRRATEREEGQ